MRRHDDPRHGGARDDPPRAAAGEALATLRFDDGAFAIYDPDDEAAWLWTADPVDL